ncbi:MAG: aminopeptidase P N-terminal domain-containing protein [Lentimicrobiaceae bacterium]|jgi:Xaa-Pro aminopeptidase
MRYQLISNKMYVRNRAKLVEKLKPGSLAIINSNDEMPRTGDQTHIFRQNSDMFYLTGLDQEKCILTLCPEHPVPTMREILFTVKTSDMMVVWNGHKYTMDEVREVSGIQNVKWLDDFEITLRDLMSRVQVVYLNQNEYPKFVTEVPVRDARFAGKMQLDFPVHSYERLAPIITGLRLVKEPEEIVQIQKACDLTNDGFRRVLRFVKPGLKEYEVEAEFTHEFIRKGGTGHAYPPIIASGANACILHYNTNYNNCNDGDLMLMDVGAEYGNYAADMTRTIPVNGKFTPRQRQVYDAVLRILKAATSMLKPGATIEKWHAEVCKLMEKELVGLGLISKVDLKNQTADSPAYFRYYMHGTGHFLGLDVHDVGSRQDVFETGMVMTCEPGIYIPEEGIGIRLENDILVAEEPVNLMSGIPIEPDEIERLMAE